MRRKRLAAQEAAGALLFESLKLAGKGDFRIENHPVLLCVGGGRAVLTCVWHYAPVKPGLCHARDTGFGKRWLVLGEGKGLLYQPLCLCTLTLLGLWGNVQSQTHRGNKLRCCCSLSPSPLAQNSPEQNPSQALCWTNPHILPKPSLG